MLTVLASLPNLRNNLSQNIEKPLNLDLEIAYTTDQVSNLLQLPLWCVTLGCSKGYKQNWLRPRDNIFSSVASAIATDSTACSKGSATEANSIHKNLLSTDDALKVASAQTLTEQN